MKISIKREQNQASLSFAERKKFRPKVKRKQLLLLLALLMTAATGAWAESTTHIVNQDNVDEIFSGDGYTLGDDVKEGDELDFQGTIDIHHSLVINKQVSITSYTEDAVISLHTEAGTLLGDAPGNSFIINKAGSGTTVTGIRIENTQTWLYNTSNVTFTGVTMWVEEARVGSGVGQVAIRYSDHVTFDGCTVYTKDNGGSSGCVLTGSSNCIFKDTNFESVGNASNPLYLGNPVNTNDKPEGFDVVCHDCTLSKCTFSGVGKVQVLNGQRHIFDNCLFNISTSFGSSATEAKDGLVIRNNTFITPSSVTFPNYSTVEGNTVTVNATGYVSPFVTFNQGTTATNNTITVTTTGTGTAKVNVNKGATLTGNTINNNVTVSANSSDDTGSTFTSNTINGTVTFAANSKNNTLTRNVITSTGDYAVVMASTADANNTVQYNTLIAATRKGDEAVNPSTVSGNTISDNSTIALMLADGTKDAGKWTATVGTSTTANPLPVGGLSEKDAVTLTYGGRLKVKGVTATTDYDPLATPLTIEAITDGTIMVNITDEDGFPVRLTTGMKYSVNGGTKTTINETTPIEGLKAGDKVQFYGNGTDTQVYGNYPEVKILGSGVGFQTKVYGNIMSLLYETGFATKTDLPEVDYVFYELFAGNTTLIDASELLLPAETLADYCYQAMFEGCTNLTTAPKLPAETLADACYEGMFEGCESLTSAYVKAAYTDVTGSCRNMFDGCSADGAVLHTTPGYSKERWETMMGEGNTWPNWSVADDWQD